MSATNRGATRNAADYYATPQWAITDFLQALTDDAAQLGISDLLARSDLVVLDPCAGGDAVNPMAYPKALKDFTDSGRAGFRPSRIHTMDIRDDSPAETHGSYLDAEISSPDIIITNPPFNLALEITEKALRDVKPGGLVIMLQRLNWFGAQYRYDFWQKNPPLAFYIHSKRIGFSNAKSTDSIEYAHFLFQRGSTHKFSRSRLISPGNKSQQKLL